jgi:hypothetical protein
MANSGIERQEWDRLDGSAQREAAKTLKEIRRNSI